MPKCTKHCENPSFSCSPSEDQIDRIDFLFIASCLSVLSLVDVDALVMVLLRCLTTDVSCFVLLFYSVFVLLYVFFSIYYDGLPAETNRPSGTNKIM